MRADAVSLPSQPVTPSSGILSRNSTCRSPTRSLQPQFHDISLNIYQINPWQIYLWSIQSIHKKYPCQDTCPGIPPSKMNGWAHFHPFRHGAGVAAAAASAASARRRPATRCFRQCCGARQGGARTDGRIWAREDPDSGWPNRWTLINGLLHFRILEFHGIPIDLRQGNGVEFVFNGHNQRLGISWGLNG